MASYGKFQSDNAKYSTKSSRNNYNPEFNNTVEAKGENEEYKLKTNIDKYIEFISWARWYPDLFLDLIKPKEGGIKLHSDQRTFMRVAMRFWSLYGVFPRGWGKTFNEEIVMFITCVLYPGIEISLTAQTKENAAELLKDKYNDILKKYPWFKNEIFDSKFSKNDAEIRFVNDSRIDVLANSSSSKGQRRHSIMCEESALIDAFTLEDSLIPIVEHGRITVGKLAINNPEELSQKVSYFTTAGYRGSDEFERSLNMKDDMVQCKGTMVLGSDWQLGCWYGRGSTKTQMLEKKKNTSPISFAQNYESKWVGSVDGALVDVNKLLSLRTLAKPKFKSDGSVEIVLGIDVARSQSSGNNQSSVAVLEIKRNKQNRIVQIMLVNLYTISNALNFTAQAIEIKKIKKIYNAKMACCDSNGLGCGLVDELMKDTYDPNTGESLGCWNTVNTDAQAELQDAENCLYDLKPQSCNSEMIVTFIDMVESGKLRLLEKKSNSNYDINDKKYYAEQILPYIQTDFLIDEITNLQLKPLNSGKVTVEKVVRKIDKDRFSSVMYGLWYIKTFEDNMYEEECNLEDYMAFF